MTDSRALRIASVCRTLPTPENPGAGIFVLRRLAAMAAASDLHVLQPVPFLYGIRPIPAWARAPEHSSEGLSIRHQPMLYIPGVLKSLDGRWLARAVLPRLQALHRERALDLVDAHFGYPDGVGSVLAARQMGVPAFITIRGSEVDRVREPRIRPQLLDALRTATGVLSVSHTLRAQMLECGVPEDQIEVIPNAIDRTVFAPGSQPEARKALDLPADGPLIVSVGHLISGKRHDVVMRVLDRLREQHPALRLAIVGGADYEPNCPAELRQLAADLRISDRVHFVGRVPPKQVAVWLRAADVFALGTVREGCCNAVLEALASGTPVVTTPVGDNPRYVFEGVNGHLVPVGDVEATARAIAGALQRTWDRPQISASLPIKTWDDTARRVLEFFSRRIAERPKRMAA